MLRTHQDASASPASLEKKRRACDECRTRKLACSKQSDGCHRCRREGLSCVYSAQKPMGRPRKRPRADGARPSAPAAAPATVPRRDSGELVSPESLECSSPSTSTSTPAITSQDVCAGLAFLSEQAPFMTFNNYDDLLDPQLQSPSRLLGSAAPGTPATFTSSPQLPMPSPPTLATGCSIPTPPEETLPIQQSLAASSSSQATCSSTNTPSNDYSCIDLHGSCSSTSQTSSFDCVHSAGLCDADDEATAAGVSAVDVALGTQSLCDEADAHLQRQIQTHVLSTTVPPVLSTPAQRGVSTLSAVQDIMNLAATSEIHFMNDDSSSGFNSGFNNGFNNVSNSSLHGGFPSWLPSGLYNSFSNGSNNPYNSSDTTEACARAASAWLLTVPSRSCSCLTRLYLALDSLQHMPAEVGAAMAVARNAAHTAHDTVQCPHCSPSLVSAPTASPLAFNELHEHPPPQSFVTLMMLCTVLPAIAHAYREILVLVDAETARATAARQQLPLMVKAYGGVWGQLTGPWQAMEAERARDDATPPAACTSAQSVVALLTGNCMLEPALWRLVVRTLLKTDVYGIHGNMIGEGGGGGGGCGGIDDTDDMPKCPGGMTVTGHYGLRDIVDMMERRSLPRRMVTNMDAINSDKNAAGEAGGGFTGEKNTSPDWTDYSHRPFGEPLACERVIEMARSEIDRLVIV